MKWHPISPLPLPLTRLPGLVFRDACTGAPR